MSQLTKFDPGSTPGTPDVQFIEGNTGGAVGPNPATFIINVTGDTVQGVHVNGTAGTYTEVITIDNATEAQKGVVLLASNLETIAGTNTTKATTPDDIKAKLGAQTLHGIPYGNATTGAVQWLAEAADGQIPIGDTGGVPILGNITSLDGSLTVTNGAGTIDIGLRNTTISTTVTSDGLGQTQNLSTIATTADGSYLVESRVTCWETGTTSSAGWSLFALINRVAGVCTIETDTDKIAHIMGALKTPTAATNVDVNVIGSGANILIQVVGIATKTINWGGFTAYVFRGA